MSRAARSSGATALSAGGAGDEGAPIREVGAPWRWGAAGVIVTAALVRSMSVPSRTPWWELDPLMGYRPETTLTPAMGLGLDALVWIAAGVMVWGRMAADRPIRLWTLLLALVGVVGVASHGLFLRPFVGVDGSGPAGDFEAISMGSAWASAIIGAWALTHIAGDAGLRRIALLTLLSLIVVLCAKGAYQALVEHSRMVQAFDADPGAMLAAKGWEAGSTSARLFERRLRQVEATGWFGLSNVYGSLAAACCVAWSGLSIGAWGSWRRGRIGSGEAGALTLIAVAGYAALALSVSKGAVGAALIGLACLGAPALFRVVRARAILARWAPWLGVLIMGGVLGLVALRGELGDGMGERSLLFRAQYLAASVRIIEARPLVGVGPSGFKDAYLLAKSPESPEEIESPHSLAFDWLARLGIFGVGWITLWLVWMRGAGMRLLDGSGAESDAHGAVTGGTSREWLLPVGCMGLSVGVSLWIERAALGADLVSLLGLASVIAALGVALAWRALKGGAGVWFERGVGAAALALAAHAMIEVTPVTPGAGAWFFAIVALAANGSEEWRSRLRGEGRSPRRVIGGFALALLVAVGGGLGYRAGNVWKWERALGAGAAALAPLGDLQDALREVASAAPAEKREAMGRMGEIIREAGRRLGVGVGGASWQEIRDDFERLLRAGRARSVPLAITNLDRAAALEPTAWEARLAAARLELTLAYDLGGAGRAEEALRRADSALGRVVAYVEARTRASGSWGRLGSMREARADLFDAIPALAERVREERQAAALAWSRAASLDPYGLTPALALWRLASRLSDEEGARRWAERAIELDQRLYLDPLKGLTDSERASLKATLGVVPEVGGGPGAP